MTLIPVYRGDLDAASPGGAAAEAEGVRIQGTTRIQTSQINNIPADAVVVAGFEPSRRVMVFKNEGAVDVYVGAEGVTTISGFRLAVGQALTLETSAEIWAVTPVGATGILHLISELDG
jgi:hypothetical protein